MSRIIYPLIVFASAALLFVFFTMPIMDKIREQKDEIARLDEVLARAEQFETLREKLVGEYNNISKENLDKLDAILPSEVNAVRRVLDIEGLANASGLTLEGSVEGGAAEAAAARRTSPASGGSGASEGPQQFPFQITVTGPYDGLIVFLGKIAQSLTLFDVGSLAFTVNADAEIRNASADRYQMKLTTYFLPQ